MNSTQPPVHDPESPPLSTPPPPPPLTPAELKKLPDNAWVKQLLYISLSEVKFFTLPKYGVYPIDDDLWTGGESNSDSGIIHEFIFNNITAHIEQFNTNVDNLKKEKKKYYPNIGIQTLTCAFEKPYIIHDMDLYLKNPKDIENKLKNYKMSDITDLVNNICDSIKKNIYFKSKFSTVLNRVIINEKFWDNFTSCHYENTHQFPIILSKLSRMAIFVLFYLVKNVHATLCIPIDFYSSNFTRLYFLILIYEKNYKNMCADLQYKIDRMTWLKPSYDEASRISKETFEETYYKDVNVCETSYKDDIEKCNKTYNPLNPLKSACRATAFTKKLICGASPTRLTDEICNKLNVGSLTLKKTRCKRLLNAKRKMIIDGITCNNETCNNVTRKIEKLDWLKPAYEKVKNGKNGDIDVSKICNEELPNSFTERNVTKRIRCNNLLDLYIKSVKSNSSCDNTKGGKLKHSKKRKTKSIHNSLKNKLGNLNVKVLKMKKTRRYIVKKSKNITKKKRGGLLWRFFGKSTSKDKIINLVFLGILRYGLFAMLYCFCLIGIGVGVGNLLAMLNTTTGPITIPAAPASLSTAVISYFFLGILIRINWEEIRIVVYALERLIKVGVNSMLYGSLWKSKEYGNIQNKLIEASNHIKKLMLKSDTNITNIEYLKYLICYIYKLKNINWDGMFTEVNKINSLSSITYENTHGEVSNGNNEIFKKIIISLEKPALEEEDFSTIVNFKKTEIDPLLLKCLKLFVFFFNNTLCFININSIEKVHYTARNMFRIIDEISSPNVVKEAISIIKNMRCIVFCPIKRMGVFRPLISYTSIVGKSLFRSHANVIKSTNEVLCPRCYKVDIFTLAACGEDWESIEKMIHFKRIFSMEEIQFFTGSNGKINIFNELKRKICQSDSINKYSLLNSAGIFTLSNFNPFNIVTNIPASIMSALSSDLNRYMYDMKVKNKMLFDVNSDARSLFT